MTLEEGIALPPNDHCDDPEDTDANVAAATPTIFRYRDRSFAISRRSVQFSQASDVIFSLTPLDYSFEPGEASFYTYLMIENKGIGPCLSS